MGFRKQFTQGGFKSSIFDVSLLAILIGNLASIIIAILQDWDIGQIMWVYWAQSVIIGAINIYRILSLKEFTTKGIKQNGNTVPETAAAKKGIAIFFSLHYGFFHLIYMVFLFGLFPLTNISLDEFIFLLVIIIGFFSAHGFSYRYNVNRDFKDKKPNLGTIMFYPYIRIIPMHLTIIFGSMMISTFSLVLFMVLKTIADAGMHMVEHHLFRKK